MSDMEPHDISIFHYFLKKNVKKSTENAIKILYPSQLKSYLQKSSSLLHIIYQ